MYDIEQHLKDMEARIMGAIKGNKTPAPAPTPYTPPTPPTPPATPPSSIK